MATDAQRLIAVSLGKIANGRGQKGGINLHKNLLVAGVLHKARTVIMIENYQVVMQSRARQVGTQNNYQQSQRENETVPESCSEGHLNRPGTPIIAADSPNPGQVAKRLAGNSESHSQELTVKSQRIDTSDKENSSPNGQSDQPSSKKLDSNSPTVGILDNKSDTQNPRGQCLRSVKRRHTDSSTSDKPEDCSVKRPKTEEKSEEKTGPEPMQTETQITNLVACFNTGFSGLLNHIGSSESDSSSDGHITSCATELKSGFSSIPTPVLALSV